MKMDMLTRRKKSKKMQIYHEIMKLHGHEWDSDEYVVDHKNREKLDNRYENLRLVSHQINSINKSKAKNATSQYFGVSKNVYENSAKPFQMKIKFGDESIRHSFKTEKEAALAYNYYIIIWLEEKDWPKLNDIDDPKCIIEHDMLKQIEENDNPTKSKYIGVYKINDQRYTATIWKNNKKINLGTFNTEIKAAEAYNEKAKEFGYPLNIIQSVDIKQIEDQLNKMEINEMLEIIKNQKLKVTKKVFAIF